MATTYTAKNRFTNQVQTFEEVAWLSKIQPSGQWILIRKNQKEEAAPRGYVAPKKTATVTAKKGCGRCGSKK
jgi:hypothetical protein